MDVRPNAQAKTIQELFATKAFAVPEYQRSYAWEKQNWEDLWTDLVEGIASGTEHYWGTITLKATGARVRSEDDDEHFTLHEVVDGQQRLTTISLFLLALARCGRPMLHARYLRSGGVLRLTPGQRNIETLERLLAGGALPPDVEVLRSNRRLQSAVDYFSDQIRAHGDPSTLATFLLTRTFVLEFVVADEALAIRAFESLNDRGRPLSVLEKTKSALMFNSQRYLAGDHRADINDVFGALYSAYDVVKDRGTARGIAYLSSGKFDENVVLQWFYHCVGAWAVRKHGLPSGYDYNYTAESIFNAFIKDSCAGLKAEPARLRAFLADLLDQLSSFTSAMQRLVDRVATDLRLRKMLVFLGVDAILYPVLVGLETRNLLDDAMLDAIERLDIRVYKVLGKRNRAGIYEIFPHVIGGASGADLRAMVNGNCAYHSPPSSFLAALGELRFSVQNPFVAYLLWAFEKAADDTFDDGDADLYRIVQLDHIWPQSLTVQLPTDGFSDEADYASAIDRLGNLCLLEGRDNARAQNKSPSVKARDVYQGLTTLPRSRALGFQIGQHGWRKADIEATTARMIEFAMSRWAPSPPTTKSA
ncbi:MAG: DUF262 domain-containing HNH endonuclease family protein [Deltaproteobacteria bacterium]|nr:DUF262 domain-containing HNH endonuclease family protein [Myxococcales bacterium]MDP3220358.1 DUF262 domain-containing HNH endonuclease family protein [Deltaproteobacteria bacterium]